MHTSLVRSTLMNSFKILFDASYGQLSKIGLKILSMRITVDLLHEFTNTRIFGLCHNCMWQSGHPGIDVYVLELGRQTGWLSTHNGSHRSISICIYVFCLCLCLSPNDQQTNWYSRSQERNVYRFSEHSNGTFVLSHTTGRPLL